MDPALPNYEVAAVRYATRGGQRRDHFLGGDPHESPMPMDYYVWFIRGAGRTIVVDTGFDEAMARQRKREFLGDPVELLARCGVDPAQVSDVVVTHLHYDHAGNLGRFPAARFHLQDREMAYATGRFMCHHKLRHGFEAKDVTEMVHLLYRDRVQFHDGDGQLAPGITLHRLGGHTDGLQCVRVHTARGWVVLASDTAHFYENFVRRRPFSTAFHVGDMFEAFGRLSALATSDDHVVPGHDPLVMARYPALRADLAGIAVRLDASPIAPLEPES